MISTEQLAQRIKAGREDKRWSQEALGVAIGMVQSSVSDLEKATRTWA